MQSYVLNLAPNGVRAFDVPADLFVYESGAPTPTGGDTRIKVKPNTGAEIVLRPGQRFRLAPNSNATHWEVSALDPAVSLAGYVIIGSGEFDDANTLNKVTLDATFANQVTVTNTAAARVPVNLDPSQTLPVSIAGNVATTQGTMQFSGSFESSSPSSTAIQVVSAAANVNGVDIKQFLLCGNISVSGMVSLIAKATAPGNVIDGDVLDAYFVNSGSNITYKSQPLVRVPAGKAVWIIAVGDTNVMLNKSVLFTIL